jgi:VanZ family protein
MALIFGLSSVPDLRIAPEPVLDFVVRKLGHAGVYAILAILLGLGLPDGPRTGPLAVGLAVAYAASDEFHQAFVPGRGPSVVDVGIDAIGAIAGHLLLQRVRRPTR